MFEMYTRALLGFALSPDGRYVAVGKDAEAAVGGFVPGLSIFDATTGAERAFDSTFTGTVLGFSPDSARLYTRVGGSIRLVASADLSPIGQFDWPADAVFLGISPTGNVVGSVGGATSWWDPMTGAIVRTEGYPLAAATWSADGRFGAGTGDPARLFHFWREADAAQLCAPPADTTSAPPLASLGTRGPVQMQSVTSEDGSDDRHGGVRRLTRMPPTTTRSRSPTRRPGTCFASSERRSARNRSRSRPRRATGSTRAGPDVAIWCR